MLINLLHSPIIDMVRNLVILHSQETYVSGNSVSVRYTLAGCLDGKSSVEVRGVCSKRN